MKINLQSPATGSNKKVEIEEERYLRCLYDQRIGSEIQGKDLGPDYAGYVFRVTGGNDKQGFAMKQGVLTSSRTRLLLKGKCKGYRPIRHGERRRKSVRGCFIAPDIAVVNLSVLRTGDKPIPGVTDKIVEKRLGPKRASNIRKLFNLSKEDDVRKYVLRRTFTNKAGKVISKSPKIQRLTTPHTLANVRRKKVAQMESLKKSAKERAEYEKLLATRKAEAIERRKSQASKRRSQIKSSEPVKA